MYKYKTYKFRIKDSSKKKALCALASKVNFVWNYCNATSLEGWTKKHDWVSKHDMQNLCSGASKEINLNAATIQLVCHEHANKRDQFKKCKLKWRSYKKSLGWIPFDTRCIKVEKDYCKFMGIKLRMWKHREIQGKVKFGSFNQNARGQWFVSIVCEEHVNEAPKTGKSVGIDLGLKTVATLSTGTEYQHPKATAVYAEKLGKAQRARKFKTAKKIHTKIANIRKDFNHKISTEVVENFDNIFVGDVSSKAMISRKKGFAKSALDASWGQLRAMLEYKASKLGKVFQPTKEAWSTITCSNCSKRTGPSGLSDLGVRSWLCDNCGTEHQRDVNAAINILNIGLGLESLNKREAPAFMHGE